ncbi:methyl-accepting chemotaxis protein [Halorubellus litoreus]|uniref:Methyl-accepting chemotaxis protein n=1 Tax=Halorubellus litoreus TaxID=755308 RepID=A0ABD5VC12_9EURY
MSSGDEDQDDASTGPSLRARIAPNFLRRRFGLKLFVLLLVVLAVVAGAGAFSYYQTEQRVQTQTEENLKATATMHADAINEWSADRRASTSAISDSDVLRNDTASTDAILDYAKTEKSRYNTGGRSVIVNVHVVNVADSELVTTTSTSLRNQGLDAADGEWTALESGDFRSSDTVWATERAYLPAFDNQAVMAYASPVPGNEDLAVVVVGSFEDFVTDLRAPGDQTTNVLTTDREPVVGDETAVVRSGFQDAVAGQPAFRVRGDTVQAYAPVPSTDWIVVSSQPEASAFAVRDTVATNVGALVAAALVSLLVVGTIIVRQTTRPLQHLRDKAAAMEEGDLSVSLTHGRIDEYGRLYDGFDSMRNSLRTQIREAQEARADAEEARADAEALTAHLERKADEYATVMQACADGDLTERMNADSESAAMESIAVEFNEMVAEIEATTAEVKAFASEVATASEEVTASSEEVRSASEQVTESIQEISDGAERQNESLQSVSGEMEQLSTTTEEIAASSNEVADLAERTAETGREGREAAETAIEGMRELQADSTDAVDAIEDLESEMSEIDELIEFIGDIAKETNMLALNANIEASRGGAAGDAGGEGFAVVAQEVKDLASEAKDAAEDIESRLERIQDQTERTAQEVQRTSERVEENAGSIENAVAALDEIADYAQETNTGVQEISAATEQQAASTQEVVAMVDDAATISEETTAESENVAAAAEEQTTALTEVSRSASNLATNASTLSDALDRFTTDASTDDAPDDHAELPEGQPSALTDDTADPMPDDPDAALDEITDADTEPTENHDQQADTDLDATFDDDN